MKLAIGDNIKSLRKSKNITQENLAEMLGVSCQSVSRWELGTCYPDMELLPELARIFNISVDQLLGVDELVEKKKWITSDELCEFYAIGASLPGIIAANTAIFTGRKLLGFRGAVAAILGMILPVTLSTST